MIKATVYLFIGQGCTVLLIDTFSWKENTKSHVWLIHCLNICIKHVLIVTRMWNIIV